MANASRYPLLLSQGIMTCKALILTLMMASMRRRHRRALPPMSRPRGRVCGALAKPASSLAAALAAPSDALLRSDPPPVASSATRGGRCALAAGAASCRPLVLTPRCSAAVQADHRMAGPERVARCGFFHVVDGRIALQRGYWDKLSLLRLHLLSSGRQFRLRHYPAERHRESEHIIGYSGEAGAGKPSAALLWGGWK
jgi:hypothetical protein